MTEQDSENIQAATAHIATAKKEASVSENLVDTLADFAEKRRQRLAGAASAAAATLASVKANLERSIAELQRECDKRDQLDAVIVGCRDAIVAIDAKLPVLNEEKKAVVAARKFKDAARVQADIKQLTDEKTEQEAKLAETVKTVEDTDAVIEKLKDSIETCRKNVASLEAEAGTWAVAWLWWTCCVCSRCCCGRYGKSPRVALHSRRDQARNRQVERYKQLQRCVWTPHC
jgi:chromosome segregation ATPase